MNTDYKIDVRAIKRVVCAVVAALLVVAGLPVFQSKDAYAAQFGTRSIQISDASPSGTSITTGVGSGEGVTYRVTFTPSVQASSMVIDFCVDSPIISSGCTAPTGMNAASAAVTNVSGTAGNADWTVTAAASQVKIARTGGTSASNIQASTQQVFDITGITNPSTIGSFYARMYSYTNATFGTYGGPDTVNPNTGPGNYVDYGGVALTVVRSINITARVQESLTFCVTSADPTSWNASQDCTDSAVSSNPPSLVLGQGSPTAVLDSNRVDTGTLYSQLSTNATHGAVINLRNSNTSCGGLSADNGTTCAIPPIANGTGAGPTDMVAGTAAFGLFVSPGTPRSGSGLGSTTPNDKYYDAAHSTSGAYYYGMDSSNTNTAHSDIATSYDGGTTSTFGSTLAYTTTPVYRVENFYIFAATPALTTPAGIYTANFSMIATGTF